MIAEIVIRGEVSLKGIEAMQGELDRLRAALAGPALAGQAPATATVPAVVGSPAAPDGATPWLKPPADRFVDKVIQANSGGSEKGWLFLKAAFDLGSFSFDEIAEKLYVDPPQAMAYNRNLGRTAAGCGIRVLVPYGQGRHALHPHIKAVLQGIFERKK